MGALSARILILEPLPPEVRSILFELDPRSDPRWNLLADRHPDASVFHTSAWLEAVHRTYACPTLALTPQPPGEPLTAAIPFCLLESPFTGPRLISLPFADHCQPLGMDRPAAAALEHLARDSRWKQVELRPLSPETAIPPGAQPARSYLLHQLDLRPRPEQLWSRLHPDSIRRKIERARRERLRVDRTTSLDSLRIFYRLFHLTRLRHGVPTQPWSWFTNLLAAFGPNRLNLWIAWREEIPMAALLTLRHRQTVVYKYGGSDPRFHALGPVPLLWWSAIEDARTRGLETFDLGRSDLDQPGLITFKRRWGAHESPLHYYRLPLTARPNSARWPGLTTRARRWATHCIDVLPERPRDRVQHFLFRNFA